MAERTESAESLSALYQEAVRSKRRTLMLSATTWLFMLGVLIWVTYKSNTKLDIEELRILDEQGMVRARLGLSRQGVNKGSAELVLRDMAGRDRLRFLVEPDGTCSVAIGGEVGHNSMELAALSDGRAGIRLNDRSGRQRFDIGSMGDLTGMDFFGDSSEGSLHLRIGIMEGENGDPQAGLRVSRYASSDLINLLNQGQSLKNDQLLDVGAGSSGNPRLVMWDKNKKARLQASIHRNGQAGFTVFDANEQPRSIMAVNADGSPVGE